MIWWPGAGGGGVPPLAGSLPRPPCTWYWRRDPRGRTWRRTPPPPAQQYRIHVALCRLHIVALLCSLIRGLMLLNISDCFTSNLRTVPHYSGHVEFKRTAAMVIQVCISKRMLWPGPPVPRRGRECGTAPRRCTGRWCLRPPDQLAAVAGQRTSVIGDHLTTATEDNIPCSSSISATAFCNGRSSYYCNSR
jgi:hypothetical protein